MVRRNFPKKRMDGGAESHDTNIDTISMDGAELFNSNKVINAVIQRNDKTLSFEFSVVP